MLRSPTNILRGLIFTFVITTSSQAFAQEGDGVASREATAESLFQEGRKLMEEKRFDEACPKLATSQKYVPAVGTLLNLADCYEKNHQLASAWVRFREALALAQKLGRKDREKTARERARRLEPKLSRLTILTRSSGVDITLDGVPMDRVALSTPIPVDAGKHTVEATAKDKKPFTKVFEVSREEKSPVVEIPVLEDAPSAPAIAAVAVPAPVAAVPRNEPVLVTLPPKEEPRGNWTGRKTLAVVVGGAGLVGLGVGAFYGQRAQSTWKEAVGQCDADFACSENGVALGEKSKRFATYSTIAFAAGGALVAGGVVLFITAPRPKSVASALSHVAVGPGTITIGGSF